MSSTYSQVLLHVVFSTKLRTPSITPAVRERLYDYLGGIIRGERGALLAIGGMPDHVHLLVRWCTDKTIAALVCKLKSHSSGWVRATFPEQRGFAWQEGYGVFSVSRSQEPTVKAYIAQQERHHGQQDFKAEFTQLLRNHGVEFDARYVWE